jgi:hypothetical protein
MSLQMTVAKGVFEGLRGIRVAFKRTDKGGVGLAQKVEHPVRAEMVMGLSLFAGAGLLIATNFTEAREINVFAATLVVQGLPFLAATLLSRLDRTVAWPRWLIAAKPARSRR